MSGLRYNFDKAIPFNNNLDNQLLYVSHDYFDTDWLSIPHTHNCTELFYCVKGIGQFVFNDTTLPVGSNDLIIVNANTEHTEKSYPTNRLEYIVLGVSNINFDINNSQNKGWLSLNFADKEDDIFSLLNELLHELNNKSRNYERIVSLLADIIIIKITRHAQILDGPLNKKDSNKECEKIKRYIDLNFHENISLDELANMVHLNKFYLTHRFTEVYDISPINYLFSVRIKESKYLLSQTNYSVGQISQILGFSSPSYFSQHFKKKVGLSPVGYKKSLRSLNH